MFSDPRPRINIYFTGHGEKIQALLDTGSQASFISAKMAKQLNLPIIRSTKKFKTANDGNLNILGRTPASLYFGGNHHKANLFITDTDKFDVLLGVDLLKKFSKITLRLGDKKIKMDGKTVVLI